VGMGGGLVLVLVGVRPSCLTEPRRIALPAGQAQGPSPTQPRPLSLQDEATRITRFGRQKSSGVACTFVQKRTGLLTEVYMRFFSYTNGKTQNNIYL
jgi:hypothetical protein